MSNYWVPINNEDWVAPEETLMDSSSNYSDLEQPISNNVFRFGSFIVALLSFLLIVYAFSMSILKFDYFSALAYQNKTVNFAIAPPRGIIFDNKGDPLVKNLPSFDLLVVSRELPRLLPERETQAKQVASTLGIPEQEFFDTLQVNAQKNAVFFAGIDLSKEQVLKIKQTNPPGFYVIASTKRSYVDGPEFSTLVGYTGKVSREDLTNDIYYLPSDTIGRLGLEAFYEDVLRGKHGTIFFTDESEEFTKNIDPLPGDNIVLNIRSETQSRLWQEMSAVLRGAGLTNGAAIVQDPRSGAILGMVSFPSYDNNVFTKEISQETYTRLFESKARPLFNRVIGGLYNPGSTIKPYLALTALEEEIIKPEDTIQDCVSISIPNLANPDNPYVFKNWRVDLGPFNVRRAIANSCNIYFFSIGGGYGQIKGLGINRIADYLKRGLANLGLGVDLPGEVNGFLPTPEWKQRVKKENWFQGDTYNVSIGQGDLLVTPLWINSYVSALANGGTIYQPQIVNRIVDKDKNTLKITSPESLAKLPFSKDVITEVRYAMRETVRSGTAKILQDLPVSVGAKTGTAEVIKGKSINALFTAFAPFDNPEIAITVLVEGSATNEGYAINVAHNFLRWYFNQSQ